MFFVSGSEWRLLFYFTRCVWCVWCVCVCVCVCWQETAFNEKTFFSHFFFATQQTEHSLALKVSQQFGYSALAIISMNTNSSWLWWYFASCSSYFSYTDIFTNSSKKKHCKSNIFIYLTCRIPHYSIDNFPCSTTSRRYSCVSITFIRCSGIFSTANTVKSDMHYNTWNFGDIHKHFHGFQLFRHMLERRGRWRWWNILKGYPKVCTYDWNWFPYEDLKDYGFQKNGKKVLMVTKW